MENSSVEILEKFAKKYNFDYWSNILPNKGIIKHRGTNIHVKYFVMEYSITQNPIYFCAFDSGFRSVYSGLFSNYSNDITPELKLMPKLWIDKFSFTHGTKIGLSELDKKLRVISDNERIAKEVITQKVGDKFLSLSKKIAPLDLVIEANHLNYNPKLDWKSIIGVKTNRWIINETELKIFLELGSKLLNRIKKN